MCFELLGGLLGKRRSNKVIVDVIDVLIATPLSLLSFSNKDTKVNICISSLHWGVRARGAFVLLAAPPTMHNQKESIKVFLRTRPTTDTTDDGGMSLDVARNTVTLLGKRREDFGAVVHQREQRTFKFSGGILHDATQERVYSEVGQGVISSVLQGYNATVLCYGQTGAGKTFTMTGTHSSYRERGLVPRALADLFNRVKRKLGIVISCRVSYLEIYNELIVDLLNPATSSEKLTVSDDPERGVVVKNLTSHLVGSEEEAMNLLFEGEANRAVAEHRLNRASSRSHTVFSVAVEIRGGDLSGMLRSKLNLVDLAGSERNDKTKSEGSVAKEAQHINKSLSFLEQVILALGDTQRDPNRHVPYRSSKLTHVLKDSLGGNCVTAMVANVWGENAHVEETTGTCKFAQRMMQVELEPNVNLVEDPAQKVTRLEQEVAALTRKLRYANRERVTGSTLRDDDTNKQVNELARDFIRRDSNSNNCDPLEAYLLDPERARTALLAVRRVASRTIAAYELDDVRRTGPEKDSADISSNVNTVGTLESTNSDDDAMYTAVGIAPADSRPPRESVERETSRNIASSSLRDSLEFDNTEDASFSPSFEESPVGSPQKDTQRNTNAPPIDRNSAFAEYKNGEGAATNAALAENKANLRDRKMESKTLAIKINSIKKQLDAETVKKEILSQNRPPVPPPENDALSSLDDPNTEIVTEEEYTCMLNIKKLKREYRNLFEALKERKSEIKFTERLIEQCTQSLVLEFEAWYKQEYGGGKGYNGVDTLSSDTSGHEFHHGRITSPSKIADANGHLLDSRPSSVSSHQSTKNSSIPYDSESSSAAYYSAQSASMNGRRKGETPQQRRIAAQSARPFAPRK